MTNELNERLLKFSIETILFMRRLPNTIDLIIIKKQIVRSCTSAGANYEEAQAASSKPDFIYKVRISLKEMRESNYWLRIILGITSGSEILNQCKYLIDESSQLKNILGSICRRAENIRKTDS